MTRLRHDRTSNPPSATRASDARDLLVPLPIRQPAQPGRWAASIAVVFVLFLCGWSAGTNSRFQWSLVGQYLFDGSVVRGLGLTLELTAIVMLLAIPLSILIATMRLSNVPVVSWVAWGFVWFFRSVPGLVQLLIWFNLAALYPTLNIGIPFGPTFATATTNKVITPMLAAVIGFTLHEVAYLAEVFRAAIVGVDRGQREAAQSLGMSPGSAFLRIVLPQAVRFVIPPTVNETIGLLKATSLVSFIGLTDLLYSVQKIYAINYETIPLLFVATIWYLVLTSVLSIFQFYLERHFGRGHAAAPAARPKSLRRLRERLETDAELHGATR